MLSEVDHIVIVILSVKNKIKCVGKIKRTSHITYWISSIEQDREWI